MHRILQLNANDYFYPFTEVTGTVRESCRFTQVAVLLKEVFDPLALRTGINVWDEGRNAGLAASTKRTKDTLRRN